MELSSPFTALHLFQFFLLFENHKESWAWGMLSFFHPSLFSKSNESRSRKSLTRKICFILMLQSSSLLLHTSHCLFSIRKMGNFSPHCRKNNTLSLQFGGRVLTACIIDSSLVLHCLFSPTSFTHSRERWAMRKWQFSNSLTHTAEIENVPILNKFISLWQRWGESEHRSTREKTHSRIGKTEEISKHENPLIHLCFIGHWPSMISFRQSRCCWVLLLCSSSMNHRIFLAR